MLRDCLVIIQPIRFWILDSMISEIRRNKCSGADWLRQSQYLPAKEWQAFPCNMSRLLQGDSILRLKSNLQLAIKSRASQKSSFGTKNPSSKLILHCTVVETHIDNSLERHFCMITHGLILVLHPLKHGSWLSCIMMMQVHTTKERSTTAPDEWVGFENAIT